MANVSRLPPAVIHPLRLVAKARESVDPAVCSGVGTVDGEQTVAAPVTTAVAVVVTDCSTISLAVAVADVLRPPSIPVAQRVDARPRSHHVDVRPETPVVVADV